MSQASIPERKAAMRKELRALLRGMPLERRAELSGHLRAGLEKMPLWREARAVMLFSPMPDEPDISPLIEQALAEVKVVCLPRHDAGTGAYSPARITGLAGDLIRSHLGLLEPGAHCPAHPGKQLDLTLVPGLGFTGNGWRLGRGKGHYDRLLTGVGGAKCGICFDEQVVEEMPAELHDFRLDCILTPTRFIPVGSAQI